MTYSVVALMTLTVLGCATQPGQKTTIGTLGGSAGGALLARAVGGNAYGIAAGGILGALVGGAIGARLDAADRAAQQQTLLGTLNHQAVGYPSRWANPQSGHSGTVVVTRNVTERNGQYCREYQSDVTINGQIQRAHGVACMEPDGSWRIQ
jgi:surface antigen